MFSSKFGSKLETGVASVWKNVCFHTKTTKARNVCTNLTVLQGFLMVQIPQIDILLFTNLPTLSRFSTALCKNVDIFDFGSRRVICLFVFSFEDF
jgi:hypothetical protein